ncbi:MAG TPA: single-stranded DNA-binding protein [Lentimicrobium sp.]|nr:single-stranded DNA-binding protein [Lentimicrobium sp.]
MARGVNKVILIGNLGKDPEVFSFDTGVKKVTFSLATTEIYRNKEGQDVEQTEWHNIVVWRSLADVAEKFLRKGSQVYIEGRIRYRTYEKDGQKKYITDIEADNINMLGSRHNNEGTQGYETNNTNHTTAPLTTTEPDDLPF